MNSRSLSVAGYSAFLAIGGIAGLYGPMRTPLEDRFGVTQGQTAFMVQIHFVGAVLGLLLLPRLSRRLPATPLMVLSCTLFLLAAVALGFAPGWSMVLGAAFCLGLSFGLIDLGENAIFAFSFAAKRGLMLNLLNGMFAIGSVAAPFALGRVSHYPSVMLGLAGLALVAMLAHLASGPTKIPVAEDSDAPVASSGVVVPAFVFMYLCYVMVEVGIGAGFAKFMEAGGATPKEAAFWTAGFWGGLVVSRFLYAAVAKYFDARRSLVVIATAALLGTLLIFTPSLRGWGVVLAGFAFGPFFPVGLEWLTQVRPNDSRAMSFVITGGCVGGILGPLLVEVIAKKNPANFSTGFVVLTGLLLVSVIAARTLVPHAVEARG